MTEESIKIGFTRSILRNWLVKSLEAEPTKEASFGRISKLLHDSIFDDPTPYRSMIKTYVANLFAWVEYADHTIEVVKYGHSSGVKLRG